ncbi:zinc finger, CCHC-type containing protein [Tanacetum coccineum]
MAEDASSKKFLVSNFNNYKMADSRPFMEQFNELLRILGQYTQHEEGGKTKNNKQNKGKKRGFNENNGGSGSNKKPKLKCWKCGKTCHFKRDCRSGNKKNNANAGGSGKGSKDQSQDQGQNLVVDAIAWWIHSSATTHVCKDRCLFKTYEPVEDGSVLYMGDDHFAPVHGKGSVVLEFSHGKSITLFFFW